MTLIAPTKIYRFASGSATGTVLSGLVVDKIEWHSFDLVDVYFSGSPTMTAVAAGHFLNITGATNTANIGRFLIVEKDPAAFRLRIKMTAAISHTSTYDEDPSPAEAIVENGGPALANLPPEKEALGFFWGEYPSADQLNTLLKNFGDWNYFFANGGAKAVQVAVVNVGYSRISSSSYTPIGGEGLNVCPLQSAAAWGSTIGVNGTPTDVTSSTISPSTTAGSRILVGSTFAVDYAGTDGNGRTVLNINGSALTGGNVLWPPNEKAAYSHFHLITSATGGAEAFKQQAYSNGVITDVVTSNGRTWAAEFPSTAAAGTATKGSNQISTLTNTYEDITSLSITISPTNNPVLLLWAGNLQLGASSYTTGFRFTDGTNNYGEWLARGDTSGFGYGASAAWLTGDLNGSKTFKCQFKSLTADVVAINVSSFHAIEITGDVQQAKPAGTCAVTSTEATITDGTTPLSLTFTPASSGKYLAILTFYGERTAGSNFLSAIKIKQGATVLCNVPHERETASGYKSPVTLVAPTGRLTAGTSYTFTATAQAGAGTTYDLKNCALFLIECPEVTESFSGDGATATLTDVAEGRTEVTLDSQFVCSTDDIFSLALIENVNGAGEQTVREWVLNSPGTADQPLGLHWVRPTNLTAGDDVVYRVDAKKATGTVTMANGGQFTVKEVPSLV